MFSVFADEKTINKSAPRDSWKLVWEEDFNESELDTTVWGYMARRKDDSRKYHSDNPDCYEFRNGCIIIKGIKNKDILTDTATYITGAITTQGKKAFANGRIEIRAKLNCATGAWPAFWLLPFTKDKGWPDDGEIDIMEHLNHDSFVYQTVHSRFTKADQNAKPQRFKKSKFNIDDFNVYGVELLSDRINFVINDEITLTYPKVDSLVGRGQFPFNREWYLMLDMQLGGKWVGPIYASEIPVEMEIDWVRFYQR